VLNALDLEPRSFQREDVAREYRCHGFRKDRFIFSLKHNGYPKAVIVIHQSDIGLNLSDLTHCIKIFILDANQLTKSILFSAIEKQLDCLNLNEMPILLYPKAYADLADIPYEKSYNLWILNTRYSDQYFGFIDKMLHMTRR
jgi:hypothetical protein